MGRDPLRYPDPLAFRPERWIPFTVPPHHEFPVFQAERHQFLFCGP